MMIPVTSPEELGRVLKMRRKELNLTQIEAGKKFNLTQKTVSNIENGRPGVQLETLFRLMSALNLEIHLQPRDTPYKGEAPW
jgi:HTH-type transcriptional regulator/antitoxin HipB